MRLDKFVAHNLGVSRKQVRRLLSRRRLRVNQSPATDAAMALAPSDVVYLDDQILSEIGLQYWMVHKPVGYVSATRDATHRCVSELLPDGLGTMHIAGRLDRDVTGLVILSNDGAWSHRLTSPRHHCVKRYRLSTAEAIPESARADFAAGVALHGEKRLTKPARLCLLGPQEATLEISEGRHHQVKRMLLSQGCKILRLHREAIGDIELDIGLGEARRLTPEEIASI